MKIQDFWQFDLKRQQNGFLELPADTSKSTV